MLCVAFCTVHVFASSKTSILCMLWASHSLHNLYVSCWSNIDCGHVHVVVLVYNRLYIAWYRGLCDLPIGKSNTPLETHWQMDVFIPCWFRHSTAESPLYLWYSRTYGGIIEQCCMRLLVSVMHVACTCHKTLLICVRGCPSQHATFCEDSWWNAAKIKQVVALILHIDISSGWPPCQQHNFVLIEVSLAHSIETKCIWKLWLYDMWLNKSFLSLSLSLSLIVLTSWAWSPKGGEWEKSSKYRVMGNMFWKISGKCMKTTCGKWERSMGKMCSNWEMDEQRIYGLLIGPYKLVVYCFKAPLSL